MNERQNTASSVPTKFARTEFHGSPCMSSVKLLVMPHEGQGRPVSTLKVQGGRPICVCVSWSQTRPSLYGLSTMATVNTAANPVTSSTRPRRTQKRSLRDPRLDRGYSSVVSK